MEDAVNDDPLLYHLVHEAVGANDKLPKAGIRRIRVWPAPLAEFLKRVSSVADALRQSGGEGRRISRDVLDSLDDVFCRWVGPDYFPAHFESRSFTSAWDTTRPSAAAWRLLSSL